jgi:hypothetical protein
MVAWTLLGNALARGPTDAGLVVMTGLVAASIGGLAGLLASSFRSRALAVLCALLPVPLVFHAELALAVQRLPVVAPWLATGLVWGSAFGLTTLVASVGFVALGRARLSNMLHLVLSGALAIAVGAVSLEPLEGARALLLHVGPYVLAAAFLVTLCRTRWWRALGCSVCLVMGVALLIVPARYEELRLTSLALLAGSGALITRVAPWGEAPAWRPMLVCAAAWLACFIPAQALSRVLPPMKLALLPQAGPAGALLRAVQRGTDFDGDGFGNALGQHDCAAWESRAHPSAHEVPGNSLDENCLAGPAPHDESFWIRSREQLQPKPAAFRGDIVLIVVDTLRYDAAAPDLPFFGALRREGVWFERAYTSSTFTSQAMVSLLSGKVPSSVPMRFRGKLSGVPTRPVGGLAPWLRRAGYDTAFAGGQEENEYFEPHTLLDGIRVVERLSRSASPTELKEAALKAYGAMDERRPRFLYVHAMWVHEPQPDFAAYARAVRELDAELSSLRRAIGNDALWIVTADHGEEFHEHGARYHASTLFDEVVHVPLAVAGAGLSARSVSAVTSTRAIFPTLAAMTAPSSAPEGRGPYLCLDRAAPCRDMEVPMSLELPGVHLHGLLVGRTKLIRELTFGQVLAYDLESDPGELKPRTPSVTERRALIDWEEHTFGDESHAWPYGPARRQARR